MAGGGNLNIASGDQAFDGFAMQNMVSYKTSDLGGDLNLALPFLSGKQYEEELTDCSNNVSDIFVMLELLILMMILIIYFRG